MLDSNVGGPRNVSFFLCKWPLNYLYRTVGAILEIRTSNQHTRDSQVWWENGIYMLISTITYNFRNILIHNLWIVIHFAKSVLFILIIRLCGLFPWRIFVHHYLSLILCSHVNCDYSSLILYSHVKYDYSSLILYSHLNYDYL